MTSSVVSIDDRSGAKRRIVADKFNFLNVSVTAFFKNPAIMMVNERVTFLKLLFRWQGSIWQSLVWDTFFFLLAFYVIRLSLIFVCGSDDVFPEGGYKWRYQCRSWYRNVSQVTVQITSLMPVTFLLGFFVSTVLNRWWGFSGNFPSLSTAALVIQANVRTRNPKLQDTTWYLKQAFSRYLNLAFIFSMRNISYAVGQRFLPLSMQDGELKKTRKPPKKTKVRSVLSAINNDPVIKATYGQLITEEEILYFEEIEASSDGKGSVLEPWIPIRWCTELIAKAGELKCLYDDQSYRYLIEAINSVRSGLGTISTLCKFNIPLVYIQAIIIIVHAYLLNELFDPEFIKDPKNELRASFENLMPFVVLIKFFLFMGWFKIGLSLINPMREDQSHFPTLEMVDSNLKFMSRFTLTKSAILPPSMQLHGEELKQALKNDAEEILANHLKDAIAENIFKNKDMLTKGHETAIPLLSTIDEHKTHSHDVNV